MKTLKKLMLIIMFSGIALFTKANDNYVKNYKVDAFQELRTSLMNFIKDDFTQVGNFFYKNDIDKFKGEVTIEFYFTSDHKIQLSKAESKNELAVAYVQQLFDDAKIAIANDYLNKKYKLTLKLDYRT